MHRGEVLIETLACNARDGVKVCRRKGQWLQLRHLLALPKVLVVIRIVDFDILHRHVLLMVTWLGQVRSETFFKVPIGVPFLGLRDFRLACEALGTERLLQGDLFQIH